MMHKILIESIFLLEITELRIGHFPTLDFLYYCRYALFYLQVYWKFASYSPLYEI